jgi:hypothetical protein
LVGVDRLAAEAAELAVLEEAGVSLRRVALDRGPVFENLEGDGHRRQRWLSLSDEIPLDALPQAWRGARAWLFVPVAGEVPVGWADVPGRRAAVGIGWQGMLREMAGDGWVSRTAPASSPLLRAAGIVCVSVDDLAPDARLEDLRRLAPDAAVVLTAGENGGIVLREGRLERYAALPSDRTVDPTGAGDVFLAALTVAWLLTGEAVSAAGLRFAAAAASCSVEGVGLAGIPTRAQLAARLRSGSAAP